MRITGGTLRGRALISPPDDRVRPTSDKARLAIFNMLIARRVVADARVLDVFCGTGALGLEAVSRGAAEALLIDRDIDSCAVATRNIKALRLDNQVRVQRTDALALPARPSTVLPRHLVFLDPPYHQNLVPPALRGLVTGGWLAPGAVLVVEAEGEWAPDFQDGFALDTEKKYGQSKIYLLRST